MTKGRDQIRDALEHDEVVRAIEDVYHQKRKHVWINPGSEKNCKWGDYYIDVIASDSPNPDVAWVIEVETTSSISSSEARQQWNNYDRTYENWHLAVPVSHEDKTEELLEEHNIERCHIVTWARDPDDANYINFRGLPD